jgi:putative transposase
MEEQCRAQGCIVRIVNGMPDHVHFLILLNPQKSIAEVVKQIKGSSSHFINTNNLTEEKFSWSTGYAAFGVNYTGVDIVYRYIANQKEHHTKGSIDQGQEFEFNG